MAESRKSRAGITPGKTEGTVWTVPGADQFKVREFDTISLLYDPRSAETHLLDAFSREVLDTLTDQPRSIADAIRALTELVPDDARDGLENRITSLIVEFDRLGLVYPVLEGSA